MQLYLCYLRRGAVYMSVLGKTEAGFYRGIEPVVFARVSHAADLRRAIAEIISRCNPIIPTPRYGETPAAIPIILKNAGVKTWNVFERTAISWKIRETDGEYEIIGQREGPYGGWVDDPDETIILPAGTSVDEMIDRLIEILQEAAATRRASK